MLECKTRKRENKTFFKHPGGDRLALGTDSVPIFSRYSKLVTGPWPQILHNEAVGVSRGRHFTPLTIALISPV